MLELVIQSERQGGKMLPDITPMPIVKRAEPFDHPDWYFELKYDGFRCLVYMEPGKIRLVSKKGFVYQRFNQLQSELCRDLEVKEAVFDGEVVCVDELGRPQFYNLLYHKSQPYYYAFDLLWLNGRDLRSLPLWRRKEKLRSVVPEQPASIVYVGNVAGRGQDLFCLACQEDLEGVIAKYKFGLYDSKTAKPWLKIKNPEYTIGKERWRLFRRKKPA